MIKKIRANIVLALILLMIPADSGLLWLVNSDNRLEAEYIPQNLVKLNGYLMRPEAKEAYESMMQDIKKAGLNVNMQSAYRPYRYQKVLFTRKFNTMKAIGHNNSEALNLATKAVAPPGASEHQLGLAIDISIDGKLNVSFGDTEAGTWIANNCHNYGFVIRYPKDKTQLTKIMYEPWHLRYVGLPHSAYMYEKNMCLEEYVEHVQKAKLLIFWIDEGRYYKVSYSEKPPDEAGALDVSSFGVGAYVVTEVGEYVR